MKKTQFRFLALLLAILLLLGSVPAVMAEETVPFDTEVYIPAMYEGVIDREALERDWEGYQPWMPFGVDTPVAFEDAAVSMKEALMARDTTFRVVIDSNGYDKTYARRIYDAAIVHTGEPTAGDYIVFNGCHWSSSSWSTYADGKVCTVCEYNLYYYTDAQQEAQMDAAVDALLRELDLWDATDYEKFCGVYRYICENITYDYDTLEDDTYDLKYTAYAALVNKTSVCQGYAALLYRLALTLGIDCRVVTGIGNGGGHGWNIVKLDGMYYNTDSTWDAIWYQAIQEYGFFLQCTANFEDHARDEEYTTAEFHKAYPMSPVDYGDKVASGPCGENAYYTVTKDNRLIFTGTGAMADYTAEAAPWKAYPVTAIEVQEGITSIGSYAFTGCTEIVAASLPQSLTAVGQGAFADCQKLQSVTYAGTEDQWSQAARAGDNQPLYRCMAAYCRGDYDFDAQVTNEDVVYLLWYTLYPEEYGLYSDADFTGDGLVSYEDVVYLLWHTLFPEQYPI